MLTQLLLRCTDKAFARKYTQYPFVATARSQKLQHRWDIICPEKYKELIYSIKIQQTQKWLDPFFASYKKCQS